MAAIFGMSKTSSPGLPNTSPNTNLVLSCIAAANAAGSRGSTKVVLMPNRERVYSQVMGAAVQ